MATKPGADVTDWPLLLRQLADILNLSDNSVRALYASGTLKGEMLGNKIIIWRWSVLEWMGLRKQGSRAA